MYKVVHCHLANIAAARKSTDGVRRFKFWTVSGRINELDVLHET